CRPPRRTHRVPRPSRTRTRASIGRADCASATSGSLFPGLPFSQRETNAPDRMNQLHSLIEVDFAPEAGDVHVDDVIERRRARRFLPDISRERTSRDRLSLVTNTGIDKVEF